VFVDVVYAQTATLHTNYS